MVLEGKAVSEPNLQGTEAAFQAQIVVLAQSQGWRVHGERAAVNRRGKWSTPIIGDPGWPDLVLAKGGKLLFWELKMGKKRLEPEQVKWGWALDTAHDGLRAYLQEAGMKVEYRVVRPTDWEFIESTLKEVPHAG